MLLKISSSTKVHSFVKQCCARSSLPSKQGISADVRKENQQEYLVLKEMKIVHNTVLKTNGLKRMSKVKLRIIWGGLLI